MAKLSARLAFPEPTVTRMANARWLEQPRLSKFFIVRDVAALSQGLLAKYWQAVFVRLC